MKRICVYSGSKLGKHQSYVQSAKKLGSILVEKQIELVYGGSKLGLMGVTADAVIEKKGVAIGVIPRELSRAEVVHQNLSKLYEVNGMHERKAKMIELSDGFIALPGGYGTFEELMEVICWGYLGIHRKPVGLLNVNGFYESILELAARASNDGFTRENIENIIIVEEDPMILIQKMEDFVYPSKTFWKSS